MITSPQNNKIKRVRALLTHAKTRRQEKRVVLEGFRLIRDVLEQGYFPDFVLHKPDLQDDLLNQLQQSNTEMLEVEPRIFDDLSDTETTQGILAVFPMPDIPLKKNASLLVALDGLGDPGNVGTILRTSAAAGVDGIILLPGTVDPFNSKALRAGMGAHFRLPIQKTAFAENFADWHIWCADASTSNAVPYTEPDWQARTILVIGSEAHGISEWVRQHAQGSVYIPMAAGVESLNSSIAAAVLLFEIRRQRG